MPGLGITITSHIIEGLVNDHQNQLIFKSEADKGTKVSFYIQHSVNV